jgi:putative methylase
VDLGCGTGIFAIGAAVLGAGSVRAIDIDPKAIESASNFAEDYGLDIDFEVGDVAQYRCKCDTVLQNPPFGSQKRTADRKFIETAADAGLVIYTIHNSKTVDFIRLLSDTLGYYVTFEKNYLFKLEHTFAFHSKPRAEYEVTLFRLQKKK